jgi:hypothetical protein
MVICGTCQTQNSPKAKFCVKCGANLRAEGAIGQTQPAQAAAPPPAPPQKQVEQKPGKRGSKKIENLLSGLKAEASLVPVPASPPPGMAVTELAEAPAEVTDVAPLLAEQRKALSAQLSLEPDAESPIHLWLNFPRAFVAGYGSVVEAKIENKGTTPLQLVDLMLESSGLVQNVQSSCRQVAAGNSAYFCIELTPARAGSYVLRCNLKGAQQDQAYAFRGTVPITVNAVPDNANIAVNISDIQCVRGTGANTGLGQEFGAVNISNLLPATAVRTVNDLLNLTFPQSFGRVPLELDYEVSQIDIAKSGASKTASWGIPKQFFAHVQNGTKLRLEPVDGAGKTSAIHVVARDEFKLGRNSKEVDFLTWFWPRSPENDDRTRRLSKVHVIAEVNSGQLVLRDAGSSNRATFEGHALSENQNDLIDQRGTLILSHEYHLDVTPFESTLEGPLTITNERLWSGPPISKTSPLRGSVRFMPINSEIANWNAVWIFTDANFGSSKLNPLVLDLPDVNDVAGRFHYYRQNFWIEDLPGGINVTVDGHRLEHREIVPIVNGAQVVIGQTAFRATIEP